MYVRSLAVAACAVAGLTLSACGTTTAAPTSTSTAMATSTAPMMAMAGTFSGLNGKHVAGHAAIADGTVTLTMFSSDQGPDLHVYLANGTTEADIASAKELGKVTYQGTETFSAGGASGYKYVVIHCDKAKAVFGAAALS